MTQREDKNTWVDSRMANCPIAVLAGRTSAARESRTRRAAYREKLAHAYDAMTQHRTPTVAKYGQRLSEKALALYAR